MPRLTRTAKFADLRNQLLNDREEYTKSKELSSYQDKLDNVKDTLVSDDEAKQNYWNKFEPPTYVQNPVNDDPIYQELLKKEFDNNVFVNPVMQEPEVKEDSEPNVEYTIEGEAEIQEPLVEEVQEQFEEPIIDDAIVEEVENENPIVEETATIEDSPVEEPKEEKSETSSFFDSFMSGASQNNQVGDNFNSYFENKNGSGDLSFEDIFTDVFKDVKDESGEIVNLIERETYLNQTISDVNTYNEENGEETINTAVENLINEIRHPENVNSEVVEQPVVEEKEDYLDADEAISLSSEEDEEFNNTLSMEISKIMDGIAGASNNEVEFEEVSIAESVAEDEEELDAEEEVYDVGQETIQMNDVSAEEKAEEVVEIKNIAEIEKEEVNTISQTIPFVVADSGDILDDEDDETGSNAVLNIILIVLIIVLVAVLGLIVFYILKTKGIL